MVSRSQILKRVLIKMSSATNRGPQRLCRSDLQQSLGDHICVILHIQITISIHFFMKKRNHSSIRRSLRLLRIYIIVFLGGMCRGSATKLCSVLDMVVGYKENRKTDKNPNSQRLSPNIFIFVYSFYTETTAWELRITTFRAFCTSKTYFYFASITFSPKTSLLSHS